MPFTETSSSLKQIVMPAGAYQRIGVLQDIQDKYTKVLGFGPYGGHVRVLRLRALVASQVQLLQIPAREAKRQSACLQIMAQQAPIQVGAYMHGRLQMIFDREEGSPSKG